jgi:PAS domain S-box-containing protein
MTTMTRRHTQAEDAAAVLMDVVSRTNHLVAVVDLPSRRVLALSRPLAAQFRGLDMLGRHGRRFIVGGASRAYPLLAAGQLEGYELNRQVRMRRGLEEAYIWIHALGPEKPPHSAVMVIETDDQSHAGQMSRTHDRLTVLGTVDDEWRIDRLSTEAVGLLGSTTQELSGRSILSLVHPGDLSEFLTGLGHAEASGAGVAVGLRIRTVEGEWVWVRAKVTPLGERAGFAFAFGPSDHEVTSHERVHDLEHRIARIAHEVHAVRTAGRTHSMPSLAEVPDLGKLTSREWEVVTEIRDNPRATDVARSLHLSPSTVRNHLSSAYRKLGVRSLAELLVVLNRGVLPESA